MPAQFNPAFRKLLNALVLTPAFLFITPVLHSQPIKKYNFNIEGRIAHFGNGFLVATMQDYTTNTISTDTIVVTNDAFKHKGYTTDKQLVSYIATNERFSKYRKVVKDGDSVDVDFADKKLKALQVVVFPGVRIKLYGVAGAYLAAYPSGDTDNVQIATLNSKIYPLLDSLGNLDYSNKKALKLTLAKEEKLVDSIAGIENRFVHKAPSSIISSYIVLQQYQALYKKDTAEANSLLNLIQPAKNDVYYKYMVLLRNNKASINAVISVGDMFPNFTTRLIYGDTIFYFNKTNGKYRLLDFWGSWCIPCVKEMPKLKQFYTKYKDVVTIIGIANDNYQNWKAFLDKNDYKWIQVLDAGLVKLSTELNIQSYPTKYLVDPTGKVINIFKDYDEDVLGKIEATINSTK